MILQTLFGSVWRWQTRYLSQADSMCRGQGRGSAPAWDMQLYKPEKEEKQRKLPPKCEISGGWLQTLKTKL